MLRRAVEAGRFETRTLEAELQEARQLRLVAAMERALARDEVQGLASQLAEAEEQQQSLLGLLEEVRRLKFRV